MNHESSAQKKYNKLYYGDRDHHVETPLTLYRTIGAIVKKIASDLYGNHSQTTGAIRTIKSIPASIYFNSQNSLHSSRDSVIFVEERALLNSFRRSRSVIIKKPVSRVDRLDRSLHPLTSRSDQHINSPYHFNTLSSRQVMRIKKFIN